MSAADPRTDTTQSQWRDGVALSWGWRIEYGQRIVCGSDSDDEDWKAVLDRMIGGKVVDLILFGRLPEIAIELDNGFHIVTFMTTEEGPDWVIFERNLEGESSSAIHWKDGDFLIELYDRKTK